MEIFYAAIFTRFLTLDMNGRLLKQIILCQIFRLMFRETFGGKLLFEKVPLKLLKERF